MGLYLPMRAAIPPSVMPAGVANLWQVSDTLYRSAQPPVSAWPALAGLLGITTVISLRQDGDGEDGYSAAAESAAVEAAGMNWAQVPMNGLIPPPAAKFAEVLAMLSGGEKVLLHCEHGADRTGAVVAAYQLLTCANGATHAQALKAFKQGQPTWPHVGEIWMFWDALEYVESVAPGHVEEGIRMAGRAQEWMSKFPK